tara:strand:+ start:2981 stop:3997 length:1017 start_codon:yes stop_codon:yes gene_type:complete
MKIIINKRAIGDGENILIIAEVGINHLGNSNLCFKMVDAAIDSGADCVKIQTINEEESYMRDTNSYLMFKNTNLNLERLIEIKNYVENKGKFFFTTPGDVSSLELVEKVNLPIIKISSGLMTNLPLIQEVCKIKKPLIISTGMGYENEIKKVVAVIKKNKIRKFALLKCTANYPTLDVDANLRGILSLKNKFNCIVGFSDHTLDDLASINSVNFGAKIIEKHFTIDKTLPGADNSISLNPKEFSLMVEKIRRTESQLGTEELVPTDREKKERHLRHRYFVTKKDIKSGEKFKITNVAMKRLKKKTKSIHAYDFEKVVNKVSNKDIPNDTVITYDDIQN